MRSISTNLTSNLLTLTALLTEGMYDAAVTQVSRDVINMLKAGKRQFDTVIYVPSSKTDTVQPVQVEVKISRQKGQRWMSLPFTIDAGYDQWDQEMLITIEYDPTSIRPVFNKLVGELKNTIRHELEHAAQSLKLGHPSIARSMGKFKNVDDLVAYHLLKIEIPAFVRGLYKQAKMEKIPLDTAIDNYFEDSYEGILTDRQVNKIKKVWLKWARMNLPAAKYSKENI